ncbi:hypothetical protein LPJ53_002496 [Coemansia erecta]|uniref:Swiss Army Knife RNA repair protein HAD domain-containing protein n=1 Tax=Coemansia erecta TaxID=147472 RepID=A0A9W8CTS5_9FUNG|nr:hypothetical protein LPJ53_002496 [Coemansia erecta]
MLGTRSSRQLDSENSISSSDESGISIKITEAQLSGIADVPTSPALVPHAHAGEQPYQISRQSSSDSERIKPRQQQLDNPIYTSTVDWLRPIGPDDFLYRQQLSQLRQHKHRITRLSIIDFDNTLFKSPLPNPDLWDQSLTGMLKSTDLGWFQDARTLSWPYLEYTEKHWIEPIEALTELESERPDTLLMLLTGRSHAAYRGIILDLLSRRQNLRFDIVILKETPTRQSPLVSQVDFGALAAATPAPLTFDYKMAVVEDTIAAFPEITEISMWDDREHQCVKMQEYLDSLHARTSDRITKAHVYHVPPQTIKMREDNERKLVNDMINEYNARVRSATIDDGSEEKTNTRLPLGSIETNEYPKFTGVFLDSKSRALLQKHIRSPRGWVRASRHMVLTMGPLESAKLVKMIGAQKGELVELVADSIGTLPNAVIAVRIAYALVNGTKLPLVTQMFESTPYITVAHNQPAGFRSSFARNIRTWRPLRTGNLVLSGTIGEHCVTGASIVRPLQKIPNEVSIGGLVCQFWPELTGKAIGTAVANVRTHMEERGVENLESNRSEIAAIVRALF